MLTLGLGATMRAQRVCAQPHPQPQPQPQKEMIR
jgi:hypothetical protein